MRIGVEEAVLEDHLHHGPDRDFGDLLAGKPLFRDGVVNLLAGQELEREHLPRRSLAVRHRETHGGVAREVAAEPHGVFGLELEVELRRDRLIELIDKPCGVVRLRLGNRALDEPGKPVQQVEIARDRRSYPRTLNFDDDLERPLRALESGAVHWPDRGRRERALVEAGVERMRS